MSARNLQRQHRSSRNENVILFHDHGGYFEIEGVDESAGDVTVAIGGACSGCGIAPMTMKAIEKRLPVRVNQVSSVTVRRKGGQRAAVVPTETDEIAETSESADSSPPS